MLAIVQINEYNRVYIRRLNMNYVTTIEMSEIWGISARRIALLCEQERIEGAIKKGKTWLIPEDAEKPADKRKNVKKEDISYVLH